MKEESRIEALEHELKILKNEIQSTLLEIREQILNHYYPELRAEEPLHSHSLPVRTAVGRPGVPTKASAPSQAEPVSLAEIAAKGQIQPFSDIFLEDLSDDEIENDEAEVLVNSRRPAFDDLDDLEELDDLDEIEESDDIAGRIAVEETSVRKVVSGPKHHTNPTPTTREVDFRQLKQGGVTSNVTATMVTPANVTTAQAKAVPVPRNTPRAAVATPVPTSALPNLAALTQWANDGVASVGKERTLEVIDTYATGGKLTGAERSALLKIVAQAEEIERDTPVGSREMLTLMVGLDQILAR